LGPTGYHRLYQNKGDGGGVQKNGDMGEKEPVNRRQKPDISISERQRNADAKKPASTPADRESSQPRLHVGGKDLMKENGGVRDWGDPDVSEAG